MIIDIEITSEELDARRKRLSMAKRIEEPDRVPVLPYVNSRYWLPKIGISFKDYFSSPKNMLEAQLFGQKWFLENIKCDKHEITVVPEFLFVEDPSSLGAEVEFLSDDIPWIKRPHLLQNEEDIETVRSADPVYGGLHGLQLEWYDKMKQIASEYIVKLIDGTEIPVEDCVCLHCGGFGGTSWVATDLRGAEQFNMDLYDRPVWVKKLLDIVADKTIEWIDYHREYCDGDAYILNETRRGEIFIGDDAIALMSPVHFLEFGLPPLKKVADHFRDKRGLKIIMHNCGRVDHLIEHIALELHPDEYWGFSYLTDKQLIKRHMAGKTVLSGGISPVTIHEGTPEEVKMETREAIEVFAPSRGYIIMDGNNIAPESPIENINAMYEAAEEYGRYQI
jgi:uroporphyrinogen-III decarboxylase